MSRRALVTGVQGQDGAYLAKFLLEQGYEVIGGTRRISSDRNWRLEELGILDKVRLVPLDLMEITNILRLIGEVRPDELYNLAAQSFVAASFEHPLLTADIGGMGAARILEVLRTVHPETRFYQASTSEMFGQVTESPQKETTRFHPRSPYGVAKAFAHYMTVNYREAHRMYACSGILFNHESPLRGQEFVTRKITHGLARYARGGAAIELGNLDAQRDWGFAGEYIKAMWMMLQQERPMDYVIATGETHSVREFLKIACEVASVNIEWDGEGVDAVARDRKSGRVVVKINPQFYRPAEVDYLTGDSSLAHRELGWKAEVPFSRLVEMMVEEDIRRLAGPASHGNSGSAF